MPLQVGTNHDWVKVTGNGRYWLGLNSEGTILESGLRGSLPRYKWADVGVGSGSSIGLGKNGMIWTWNSGNPGLVGTNTNWVAVANPNTTYLALRNDGTLWAWGRITGVRSGRASLLTTNINEPALVNQASDWVSLDADGQLRNRAGELWDATSSVPNSDLVDASNCRLISTNWRADHIETGSRVMAARVQRDGILWSAIPDGTQTLRPISSRSDWVSVWAFNSTAFGMTADGTIWTWGLDLGRIPTTRLQTLKLRIMSGASRPRNDMLLVRQEPRPLFKLTYH
jgi:alpha-tubulin suppressor-like RCC1 family protein